jgi:hypothetical protein
VKGASIDERKFTDQEVRDILKRAVERPPSRALVQGDGLSLAQLKAVGQEVGIDPASIEEAARAVTTARGGRAQHVLGAPMAFHLERTVSGELRPRDAPEILSLIRRTMGRHGDVDQIHDSLEWTSKGDAGSRLITVASRDKRTTIRASANLTPLAVVTYLPAGLLGLFASAFGISAVAETGSAVGLVGLAAVPVLYASVRAMLARFWRSESSKLQRVVDELAQMAEGQAGDHG